MKRLLITVAYDGTNYHGWQLQPLASTIEGVLNNKLSYLLKEDIKVIGASRTDAGVHAFGNVAVFDTNTRIPADKLPYAINQRLPEDIKVQSAREVDADFHPRRVSSKKTYEYLIYNAKFINPIYDRYSHFVYKNLDIEAMRRASSFLVGEHDFKSFCSTSSQIEDTHRIIYKIEIITEGPLIRILITGNGFLYNMVRIITGTLIEAGLYKILPEEINEIIRLSDRTFAGPTAPAKGLMLKEIFFDFNYIFGD